MKDAHVRFDRSYSKEAILLYLEEAKQRGLEGITFLEPAYKFKECQPLYREVCAMHPYQKEWYHSIGQTSIREYQRFIEEMRTQTFSIEVRFGLEVCYFTEHEAFIEQMKKAFSYDVFVGTIQFIDHIAFAWPKQSMEMLWSKYHAGFLYRRYYEMMNALITSGLFDGVAGFDSIKALQVSCRISLQHTYHKLAVQLAKQNMFVEDDTSLAYRYQHPDGGLAAAFLTQCQEQKVSVLKVSNASKPEEVGKLC